MPCMRLEIESMWGRNAPTIPAIPLNVFPKATPRPIRAGFTEPARSVLNVFHQGDLKPADALSCSVEMASAADFTNGVRPGSAFRSPLIARVKMGMTCGCSDRDHAENAERRFTNASNVSLADGVIFASAAWYLACARAA